MWEAFESGLKQSFPFLDGMLYSKELWSAFLGGLMSTATAAVIFWLGNRDSRLQRQSEDTAKRADLAFSGYTKIFQAVSTLANMKRMFDRAYEAAHKDGHSHWEPFQVVGPMAGKFQEPQMISAAEGAFLLKQGSVTLFQNAMLLAERVNANIAIINKITETYERMYDWLDGLDGIERAVDGDLAKDRIPDQYLPRYSMFAGALNGLLVDLMTTLDEDVPMAVKLANDYIDAAKSDLKDAFPSITTKQIELS